MSNTIENVGKDILQHRVDVTDFVEMVASEYESLYEYCRSDNPHGRPLEVYEMLNFFYEISLCDDVTIPRTVAALLEKDIEQHENLEDGEEAEDVVDDATLFLHSLAISFRRNKQRIIEMFKPIDEILA